MPAIYKNGVKIAGSPDIPVVQTTGTSTTDVMSQNAVTEVLPEVVQITGTSTTRVMSQNAVTEALSQCIQEGTPVNITEKYYDAGSDGTINLANGHVQSCGANTITLPAVPSSGTVTLTLYVTSTSVTWSSNIKWIGGSAPTLADVSVINFESIPDVGKWVGSLVGAVKFAETSESGRTFQRNSANTGTIMTWNDSGTVHRTIVFDAAYRTSKPFYSNNTDLGLPTYTNEGNTVPSSPASGSDTLLNADNNFNQDTRGNTAATTAIIAKVGSDDCAANYVRGLTSLNASGCDLPTINCLARIYNDRAILDSMDPTVSSYSQYSLVSWSFSGCTYTWASSWYGYSSSYYRTLCVINSGYVSTSIQYDSRGGVTPVLDL